MKDKKLYKSRTNKKINEVCGGLLEEYDIQAAEDIQDALKDLLGGTIKEMIFLHFSLLSNPVFCADRGLTPTPKIRQKITGTRHCRIPAKIKALRLFLNLRHKLLICDCCLCCCQTCNRYTEW